MTSYRFRKRFCAKGSDGFLMDDYTLGLEKAGTAAISGLESYHPTHRLDKLDYVRLPEEMSRD